MTTATRGDIYRNTYGGHVIVGSPAIEQGDNVLHVYPCDAAGRKTSHAPIPMSPAFPGRLWTHVGRAS